MARKVFARHGRAGAALVATDRVALPRRRAARAAGAGLASIVGGWKGAEDLVKAVRKARRTRPRRPITLD